MTEPNVPPFGAPTREFVRYEELRVGGQLTGILEPYMDLCDELTDIAGPLIDLLETASNEPGALHARSAILARLISDGSAAARLVRSGYAPQAVTLVATMLELFHIGAYIGKDDTRGTAYFGWNNPEMAYPGISLRRVINQVAEREGLERESATREYEQVYRTLCLVKHGNPTALYHTSMANVGETTFIVIGPLESEEYFETARLAMFWTVRYELLALLSYVRDVVDQELRRGIAERLAAIADQHQALGSPRSHRSE